jgi:hypothetical protein
MKRIAKIIRPIAADSVIMYGEHHINLRNYKKMKPKSPKKIPGPQSDRPVNPHRGRRGRRPRVLPLRLLPLDRKGVDEIRQKDRPRRRPSPAHVHRGKGRPALHRHPGPAHRHHRRHRRGHHPRPVKQYQPGGLIYFDDNLKNPTQTQKLLADTKQIYQDLGLPAPFLAVDEEGGEVARVAGNAAFGVQNVGDMRDIGALAIRPRPRPSAPPSAPI